MSTRTVSSVKNTVKPGNQDSGQRWAALDSRLERLANASDQPVADAKDGDRARDLKVAS
jgi:hypothetical protein